MTDRRIVKPKDGRRVFDPYGRVLPEDGALVKWSSWWERRKNEGAVTDSPFEDAPSAAPEAPPPPGGGSKSAAPKQAKKNHRTQTKEE